MHKFFIAIHFFVTRNRVLAAAMALGFLVIFGYFASKISFEEDITRLIPKNEKSDEAAKVLGQLNFADKITVIINAKKGVAPEELAVIANAFTDSVQATCKDYIKGIQGRVDDERIQEVFGFVYNNLPLFLDDSDYKQIEQKLSADSIASVVNSNYRNIISPSGLVTKDFVLQDPFGISFIGLKKLQQFGMEDEFHLQDGYVITKDNQKLLLFINPKLPGNETEKNTLFVDKLDAIRDHLNARYKDKATIEYFGATNIAVANARQIKSDIQTTTIVALSLLMLILMLYYRKFFIPLIILIPTIFGVVFAIALLYFLRGTISAISLSIGSILLGVTIDYALHILTHYKHNSDIRVLYRDIVKPLIMSSTTTAVAFLCLLFVNSGALQDLGIFAATSVMVSSLFSLLIIPHLYKPKTGEATQVHHTTVLDRLAGFSFHNNKVLIAASVLIIVASFFTFNKVVYDKDISQLNYVPDDIKLAEKHLESATNLTSKSLYVVAYGTSPDEVLQKNSDLFNQLSKDKTDNKLLVYNSIGGIVLSKQQQLQKIERWNNFWTPAKKAQVKATLIAEGVKLGFKPNAYERFYNVLDKKQQSVTLQDYLNIKALPINEFVAQKDGFYTVATLVKVSKAQRDAEAATLSAKPKIMVIDRQQMNETFLGGLKDDFNALINYSFVALLLILFFFFRRIELVLISSIPIIITGIVTTGIMAVFDIRLNIFSTIVCTLVFGHGVDFSIFMTSALQKEYSTGKNEMATYRTSILLAVLTTILGIGALVFAGHPALKSISSVSLIGVFAALIITFIFYPILFRFFLTHRVNNGKAPFELRTLVHSTISFIYYGLGGFLLSITSFVLVAIFPAKRDFKMKVFRYILSKFMKSVLYINPFIKKTVLNPHNETFDKPAVIIANHTSFLDILAVGMLSPKIIYLVSDWVYNSPIFGIGVKLAGFYPVSQGVEGGVEHLRDKVAQGYSLVVFPEGTRSKNNHIQRFHKGAFYLAEQFGLDIVPILIHGNAEVLPKGDFIINDGSITLKILERIRPDDTDFGSNYSERTKKIGTYFKAQFAQMRIEQEGVEYFKNKIVRSFAYKEYEIIKEIKAHLKDSLRLYHELNNYIGTKSSILQLADDHGETATLLALQHSQRRVSSYIPTEEKRDVACTNYINKGNHITYLDSPEAALAIAYDVVVIDMHIENLNEEVLQKAHELILVKQYGINTYKGFETKFEGDTFVVLRKG
ncbi:MMPL family transporter [Flavobacterium subsaxonicum]|uniref:Glycerol acyltransferase n=1 Tax=Flavobacterium subsaxonicum WB 4.1-42 = DSM 21790 TaxID=1121898 RepID=A0A0A2MST9_9FLAO|nr:MMPL family transporter [Flavobacterium subsaxonicum]KGO91295.1 glycerol acyltransferase [Flavobacterium subsaxonicum WB 4.1-42 = DSM 21790]